MNIKTFDLNLLRVLDALLSERSVTRAAQRLNLSQPAVSNALARLRSQMGDALLVRGTGGLLPTPRAEALRNQIREILETIENTLTPKIFYPEELEQTFHINMHNYLELMLLPELLKEMRQRAPKVKLAVQGLGPDVTCEKLLKGSLDVALGYFAGIPDQLFRQHVLTERFICLVGQQHPNIQGSMSMEQFLAEDHILVSTQGGKFVGVVDDFLAKQGLKRNVVLSIPHFTVAPSIVTSSNLIITMTERIAKEFSQKYPVQVIPAPLSLPEFSVSQIWHARTQNEPAQRWLREMIQQVAARIDKRQ